MPVSVGWSRSWTESASQIAAPRLGLTDRAGRWATFQVGAHGRTVAEVASDLGCDWHTVNRPVIAYGAKLVDDPERLGSITALADACYLWAFAAITASPGARTFYDHRATIAAA